jgi:hypothetical protein
MKEKISRDALKEVMIGRFGKAFPTAKIIDKGAMDIEIQFAKDDCVGANLNSLYEEVNSDQDMEEAIANRINVFVLTQKQLEQMKNGFSKEEIQEHIRLQVKDDVWFKAAIEGAHQLSQKKTKEIPADGKTPWHKPFVNNLVVAMVMDYPEYCMYMMIDHIKQSGYTEEELIQLAVANNERKQYDIWSDTHKDKAPTGPKQMEVMTTMWMDKGEPNIYNLICTPKRLSEYLKHKKSIVVVPFRNFMMSADYDEKNPGQSMAAFTHLWMIAQRMTEDRWKAYPLSEIPFIVSEDGVVSKWKLNIPGLPPDANAQMFVMQQDMRTGKKEVKGLFNVNGDQ